MTQSKATSLILFMRGRFLDFFALEGQTARFQQKICWFFTGPSNLSLQRQQGVSSYIWLARMAARGAGIWKGNWHPRRGDLTALYGSAQWLFPNRRAADFVEDRFFFCLPKTGREIAFASELLLFVSARKIVFETWLRYGGLGPARVIGYAGSIVAEGMPAHFDPHLYRMLDNPAMPNEF